MSRADASFLRYLAKRVIELVIGAAIVLATVVGLLLIGKFVWTYPRAATAGFVVVCLVGWVYTVYLDYKANKP